MVLLRLRLLTGATRMMDWRRRVVRSRRIGKQCRDLRCWGRPRRRGEYCRGDAARRPSCFVFSKVGGISRLPVQVQDECESR